MQFSSVLTKKHKKKKNDNFYGRKVKPFMFPLKTCLFLRKSSILCNSTVFYPKLTKKRKNSIFYGRKVKKFMFQFKTCLFLRKSIIFCNFLVFWQKLTKRRKMTTFMGDKRYSNLSIRPRQVHLGRCGLFGATITKILAY